MALKRSIIREMARFEDVRPHQMHDFCQGAALVVDEAYPEGCHAHRLGIRKAIGTPLTARQVVEIAEKNTTVKAALADFNAPKDNLLYKFFRRRGL
jgi:hypothetical protein